MKCKQNSPQFILLLLEQSDLGLFCLLSTDFFMEHQLEYSILEIQHLKNLSRASDFFFQDLWAKVTHEAKNGGSISEMMGPSISN